MKVLLSVTLVLVAVSCSSAEPWFNSGSQSDQAASSSRDTRSASNSASPSERPSPTCATTRGACQNLDTRVATGINNQILEEFKASYTYLAMASFFDQDNQALRGFAKFFRGASDEERGHGTKLMDYLNKRGGNVQLKAIPAPTKLTWASAKEAVDDALALEKIVNGKLLDLHWTAQQVNDPDLTNLLEGEYLEEQVTSIKQLSDWASILARFGTNKVGEHIFDQELFDGKR